MEIGMTDYYIKRYGLTEGAKKMVADGYAFLDYQLADIRDELYTVRDEDFLKKVMGIKRELDSAGLRVSQMHGPFGDLTPDGTEEERAVHFEKMTKAMVMAKYLGAKYMAIHPLTPFGIADDGDADEVIEINRRFYSALAKVAGKLGIILCLENLPFPKFPLSPVEKVADLVREINHKNLKMCFDTGHANIFEGRISEKLRYAGDLIRILHVHDNMGDFDSHLCPYEGTVDWADFAEGLFDIGFDGVFNLETAPVSKKQLDEGITDSDAESAEKKLIGIAKLIAG